MYRFFFKRVLDVIFSMFFLILLSPLFVLVILVLVIESGFTGVFFIQERPGKNELNFYILKFKSMNNKKDKDGILLPDAQRLTVFGRILRKTSIDELPQLINILFGKMSFIGPRPLLSRYLSSYSEYEKRRHDIRPGITGLAQISGRNELDWNTKLKLDVMYLESMSFKNDLIIIIKTIKKVIKREGVVLDKVQNFLDVERKVNNKNI